MMKNSSSEFQLIDSLQALSQHALPETWRGIGDDCAFLPKLALEDGSGFVLSVDTQVEGVHFRSSYFPPADIGWRSLSVAVSDIAAMGAQPLACLVSLQRSSAETDEYLQEVYQGLHEAAAAFSSPVIGGDTVATETFSLSLTVIGRSGVRLHERASAQHGDDVWVTGALGGASLGFALLENLADARLSAMSDAEKERLKLLHLRPQPQLLFGSLLQSRQLAHAMIDVSDGVFADAGHLAEKSNIAVVLDWQALPCDQAVGDDIDAKAAALTHGDDYQLLFTAAPAARAELEKLSMDDSRFGSLVRIGEVTDAREGVHILYEGACVAAKDFLADTACSQLGHQHF